MEVIEYFFWVLPFGHIGKWIKTSCARMGERLIYRDYPSKFTTMELNSCLCLAHAEFTHKGILQDVREVDIVLHGERIEPAWNGQVLSHCLCIVQLAIG